MRSTQFFQMLIWPILLVSNLGCQPGTSSHFKGEWQPFYLPRHAEGFHILTNHDTSAFRILLLEATNKDTLKDWVVAKEGKQRTVCLSTTHVPMFQSIHALDQLVGVGFAHLIKNPDAQEAIKQGSIVNISQGEDISEELMLSLQPDQFLIYSYGDKDYSKYQLRGIEVIPIAEYLEKTPLGRSEWVVLIAALSGKINEGITVFNELESTYMATKRSAENLQKPTVFTGYYNAGNWYAPPGNSFVATFLQDAGADYILKDSLANENLIIPFEQMFVTMHGCEFWGKLTFLPSDPTASNFVSDAPQLAQLPSYKAKKLFFCNTQATDYFGDAIMQPDLILKDLIQIFHPSVDSAHKPVYFKLVE
jgi:iron complex transport system substrate-binding protein